MFVDDIGVFRSSMRLLTSMQVAMFLNPITVKNVHRLLDRIFQKINDVQPIKLITQKREKCVMTLDVTSRTRE